MTYFLGSQSLNLAQNKKSMSQNSSHDQFEGQSQGHLGHLTIRLPHLVIADSIY